jgi:hypothetical protein
VRETAGITTINPSTSQESGGKKKMPRMPKVDNTAEALRTQRKTNKKL